MIKAIKLPKMKDTS